MKHLFCSKKLKYILMITIVFCLFFSISYILSSYIFAQDEISTIVVGQNGSSTAKPIFTAESGLWYPGHSFSSVLRVVNGYSSTVNLNKLGMDIILERNGTRLNLQDNDAKDYMNKMLIKIDYRNPIKRLAEGSIFYSKFNDFINGKDCSVKLGKNDYIDLIYTIKMDESAEVNISGITSKTDFTVSVADANMSSGDNINVNKDDDDTVEVFDEPIPDIAGHWAHDCIITLLDKGIITGYEDGTIKPDNYITRLEAAVLIAKALKLAPDKIPTYSYIDKIPKWSQGYVSAVTKIGVFKGYPGRRFMAEAKITREQMTAVLIRAFLAEPDIDADLDFSDKVQVGDWAMEYVKAGARNKIIEGYPDGTFRPKNNITRAETFTIICKLLKYHQEH